MDTGEMVYWLMVGVLALQVGSSLSRNIDEPRAVERARAQFQLIKTEMASTADLIMANGNSKTSVAMCDRTVQMDRQRSRLNAVFARIDTTRHKLKIDPRNRAQMVVLVSR